MLGPFLAKVTDPQGGGLSPERVGWALKMSVSEMSKVTRLHRNT